MKKIIIGIAVAILFLSTVMTFGTNQSGNNISNSSFPSSTIHVQAQGIANPSILSLQGALPTIPEKVMVYETVNGVTAEETASIAKKFGFNGEIREIFGDFAVVNNPTEFSMNRTSGTLTYQDNSKGSRPNAQDTFESLPPDDQAVTIARNFLISKGIWPDDAVFQGTTYNPTMELRYANGTLIAARGLKGIEFSRVMNGSLVFGDIIDVDIGSGGDVVRIFKHWRKYKPYKEVSIITPDLAYRQLNEGGIKREGGFISRVTINAVQLGYYSLPPVYEQHYLKPVYAFQGTAVIDNRSEPFVEYVAAAPVMGDLYS
jgi:hypothetical protein